MNSKFLSVLFILLTLLLVSCNSIPKSNLPEEINPNVCRINGTIVSIIDSKKASGPCANYPCEANVIIENVIGTGFGFKKPLIKADTIKLKFSFTLAKTTKKMYPNLNVALPGLKVGSSFSADVEIFDKIKLNPKDDSFEYIVNVYDKLK